MSNFQYIFPTITTLIITHNGAATTSPFLFFFFFLFFLFFFFFFFFDIDYFTYWIEASSSNDHPINVKKHNQKNIYIIYFWVQILFDTFSKFMRHRHNILGGKYDSKEHKRSFISPEWLQTNIFHTRSQPQRTWTL